MTSRQRLELRLSKARARLNEIAGLEGDVFTPGIRAEAETLEGEYSGLEVQYRAAIVGEAAEEDQAIGLFPDGGRDGDGAELRQLLGRVTLADYLQPALAGVGITGAAAELAAALGVDAMGKGGGVSIPWRILETRAYSTTTQNDGPEAQRPILQRLFGPGVLDALGVRLDSVPVGRVEWPLLTGSAAPAQAKEPAAGASATAASFDFANLKPKRLTGSYSMTHEMLASVPGIEQALRRDLADSVKSSMSQQLITGPAPTNAAPQNVAGLITALTAVDDSAEADAARYGRLHSSAVDGLHASRETEVMSVIGTATYQHAASVYIAGSGESGSELLSRRSGGCQASSYIPAKTGMIQNAILHAAGPGGGGIMRGDSVAAVWPTLEIVRDLYSQASQGVVLTWVGLWDAKVALRSAAYKLRGIHIG